MAKLLHKSRVNSSYATWCGQKDNKCKIFFNVGKIGARLLANEQSKVIKLLVFERQG